MTDEFALTSTLKQHRTELDTFSLQSLFDDPRRVDRFQIEAAGLFLDYSKNFCADVTLNLFERLAIHAGLPAAIAALQRGDEVNITEHRPALHTALRASNPPAGVRDEITQTNRRLRDFVEAIRSGSRKGFNGQPITDVINIGIGGSDLGPRMAVTALTAWHSGPRIHFVANVDPVELTDTLAALNPATTLVITASKSFTTLETRANSLAARAWLVQAAADADVGPQLAAITANPAKAREFGIEDSNIFPMWDWVGGRFSLWSAIGASIALAIGWDHFETMLQGAAAMDAHYLSAAPTQNMPAMLALLECWYLQYWDAHSVAVLPYSHRLRLFPAFLQQLSMESLGKSTNVDGQPVQGYTGAVIWGEPGTNSQHSFMQLLHQGTRLIPVDFILPLTTETHLTEQHAHLVANCLSQSRALMVGKTAGEVEAELRAAQMPTTEIARQLPHRVLPGNRPSNTLTMQRLEPATLGALIALYEHKTHAQGVLWRINAFDQWGVELGKKIEGQIFPVLEGAENRDLDPSTTKLAQRFTTANL